MDAALRSFLEGHVAAAREDVFWPNVGLAFNVAAYLTETEPPLALVTSVRAVLRRSGSVFVFDDPVTGTPHIVPGGHREPGESPMETLTREVLEETGCRIDGSPRRLGVLHFHLLSPRPTNDWHPYPDTLQLVYAAWAREGDLPTSRDDFVVAPRFVPATEVTAIGLALTERVFLDAGLALRV